MSNVEIGAEAPGFELTSLDGQQYRLADLVGRTAAVVLDFWSAECPWSSAYDAWLSERAPDWAEEEIHFLAIASNLDESPERIAQAVAERDIAFPILLDQGCAVADLYGAGTTPHLFVIDRWGRLAYQGAMDDRTFRKRQAEVNYLELALDALRQGRPPEPAQTAPYGCTVVRFAPE